FHHRDVGGAPPGHSRAQPVRALCMCYSGAEDRGGRDTMSDDVKQQIQKTIGDHRVVVFMKGTKHFPQCGFSARVVEILKRSGVEFKDVNVLADPVIRQGIKDFSSWPTIPQVYIDGKFVGGSDILTDMFESGELAKLLTTSKTG